MDQMVYDVATLGAIIAAIVGVAKELGMPTQFSKVASIIVAAVFVLLPAGMSDILVKISVLGLTAAGAYSFVKPNSEKHPS